MRDLVRRDCTATEAMAAAKADEALGYVVRKMVEGVKKRSKHNHTSVTFPVYSEKAGMCHVALSPEEIELNGPEKLDAIVAQKLAMLDTFIEEMDPQPKEDR